MTVAFGRAILLIVLASLTLSACQGYRDGSSRTAGEFTDDVLIQSRVKLALINDADIKGLRIDTEVNRGIVILEGRVANHELRQRAVVIASGIKGVTRVDNRLTVSDD